MSVLAFSRGGSRCRHECEIGAAAFAVPGGVCQTCDQWEGE